MEDFAIVGRAELPDLPESLALDAGQKGAGAELTYGALNSSPMRRRGRRKDEETKGKKP